MAVKSKMPEEGRRGRGKSRGWGDGREPEKKW